MPPWAGMPGLGWLAMPAAEAPQLDWLGQTIARLGILKHGQEIRSYASERERTATALPARCPSEKAGAAAPAAGQDGSISWDVALQGRSNYVHT
jgi:hypothetical protein